MQAHFCRTVVALGSPQSWDEPSGWGHCAGPPCPAVEWLLMLQSQESRDAQTLHPNGGSTENTTARQCCRQREGHFVAKVFFFFLDMFFLPSCISLRGFVDSVGRAKWEEFKGRSQFKVTA